MLRTFHIIWAGATLHCPACRQGRIATGLWKFNRTCPHCGVVFEREEGDWVGAMVVAYAITAVLVVFGIYVVELYANLTLSQHAWLWGSFTALFLLRFYRNMKGIWIGILHVMIPLSREES